MAKTCDRYGVSDRCAAALVSSTLKDIEVVNSNDKSGVVDRSKIRRERHKYRQELLNLSSEENISLPALYFDGRRDLTRLCTFSEDTTRYYPTFVKEEHIVLVGEPGSSYLSHVSPLSGTASDITKKSLTFLNIDMGLIRLQGHWL